MKVCACVRAGEFQSALLRNIAPRGAEQGEMVAGGRGSDGPRRRGKHAMHAAVRSRCGCPPLAGQRVGRRGRGGGQPGPGAGGPGRGLSGGAEPAVPVAGCHWRAAPRRSGGPGGQRVARRWRGWAASGRPPARLEAASSGGAGRATESRRCHPAWATGAGPACLAAAASAATAAHARARAPPRRPRSRVKMAWRGASRAARPRPPHNRPPPLTAARGAQTPAPWRPRAAGRRRAGTRRRPAPARAT